MFSDFPSSYELATDHSWLELAPRWGAGGRPFKSGRPDQTLKSAAFVPEDYPQGWSFLWVIARNDEICPYPTSCIKSVSGPSFKCRRNGTRSNLGAVNTFLK